jgi:hypothetical protein
MGPPFQISHQAPKKSGTALTVLLSQPQHCSMHYTFQERRYNRPNCHDAGVRMGWLASDCLSRSVLRIL